MTHQGAHLIAAAPEGTYRLLFGHDDAAAPNYELARMRPLLANLAAGTATLDATTANPDYRPVSRLAEDGTPWSLILWIVLGLAVLILGGITLRAARKL